MLNGCVSSLSLNFLSISFSFNEFIYYPAPASFTSYNHAVHVIRLRIHLLQKKLQTAELRARSSSLYLCPGYATKICNGRYNETDAQQIVDPESGLFLCRECVRAHTNNPNPPCKSSYTLKLLDNQKEVTKAMNDMRRVRVQLSSKVDNMQSSQPLRQGIFDLLQKVRSTVKGGEPLTSNLPSENIAMGIGSKRIVGTGRTAGILLKKQQKQGIVPLTNSSGGNHLNGGGVMGGGRLRGDDSDELTFLKNAIGQEIAFELEKGGGARANLLATRGRLRNKLIDAAAMKVGVDVGMVARVIIEERERQLQRRREEKQQREKGGGKKKKPQGGGDELHFLQDNLGVLSTELSREQKRRKGREGDATSENEYDENHHLQKSFYYIPDETDELWNLPEEDRRAAFQAQYKAEVERQKKLLGIGSLDDNYSLVVPFQSHVDGGNIGPDEELENVAWEDG